MSSVLIARAIEEVVDGLFEARHSTVARRVEHLCPDTLQVVDRRQLAHKRSDGPQNAFRFVLQTLWSVSKTIWLRIDDLTEIETSVIYQARFIFFAYPLVELS